MIWGTGMNHPVVVVGGGLAGLVCARRLFREQKEVLLLEASDRVGGRLKTDEVEGFRLDRGFQVYFDAYPHTEIELNESALDLRSFEAGARVLWGKKFYEVTREDPLQMAFMNLFGLGDKVRTLTMSKEVAGMELDEIWGMDDQTAELYLRGYGFSDEFIERFCRPFFGGVFLDRSLTVSKAMFLFVWRMLNGGNTTVPNRGMEEIPKQIASEMPGRLIRTGAKVTGLVHEGGAVTGVTLANGESIPAAAVVVATDAPSASQLTGTKMATEGKGCTTIWFDAPNRPIDEPILVLNGDKPGRVNHMAVMSRVAPGYGVPGRHLIMATALGDWDQSDDHVAGTAKYEIASWYPGLDVSRWHPLRVDRIRYAQMAMSPGFTDRRPSETTDTPGLFLAGEFCTYSSIDGAVLSGRRAADAVVASLNEREPVTA